MLKLSPKKQKEYFERCYKAVDGLWFMKTEDRAGFQAALDVDTEVWTVMPKIQARQLKAQCRVKDPLKALEECFTAKLVLEGFRLKGKPVRDSDGLTVTVAECPWMALLKKSGREHLADKIGSRICSTEYSVWAGEFLPGLKFDMGSRICRGGVSCVLNFRKS